MSVYRITVDNIAHGEYGFGYPVTYKFSIPPTLTNAKAFHKHWAEDSWEQIGERISGDLFNGIEAVRFDYANNLAYISVAFDDISDDVLVLVTDEFNAPQNVEFIAIPEYYDDRQAAVVITLDDYAGHMTDANPALVSLCQARGLWVTLALIAGRAGSVKGWPWYQAFVDGGFVEIASHSFDHPHLPYADYDLEIGGSRDAIIANLDLPAIYRSGVSGYVPAWIEPYAEFSTTVGQKLGQYKYLISRHTNQYQDRWAQWHVSFGMYGSYGYSIRAEDAATANLAVLNARFDDVYSQGGIYHLQSHPSGIADWSSGGYWLPHIDHIKERPDVWYVGFGAMYMYHYAQERGKITLLPTHILTIGTVGQGTTNPAPGAWEYPDGALVRVSAIPTAGWLFDHWEGDISSLENPVEFVITRDMTITAVFSEVVVPPEQHSVSISVIGQGTTDPAPGTYLVDDGTILTITAIPAEGWLFDHWEGDISGTMNPVDIEVLADISVVCNFTQKARAGCLPVVAAGILAIAIIIALTIAFV